MKGIKYSKTFKPGFVYLEVCKSPVLPQKWRVKDVLDAKLCAFVVKAFGKVGMSPSDFEEIIHAAREYVYEDCKSEFHQGIGLPYAQWASIKVACEKLEIPGVECLLHPRRLGPYVLEAPPDRVYSTMYTIKVFKKKPPNMEGVDVDRWGLFDQPAQSCVEQLAVDSSSVLEQRSIESAGSEQLSSEAAQSGAAEQAAAVDSGTALELQSNDATQATVDSVTRLE